MLSQENIEKIRGFCSEQPGIAALYVFGSAAAGKDRKKSDIDLAIMSTRRVASMERVQMETALSNLLHRDVDLVVFDQCSPLLQHQILANGRMIYQSDPRERVRQEVYARKAYFDTSFLYRKLKEDSVHG